jgi:hypothetical protein
MEVTVKNRDEIVSIFCALLLGVSNIYGQVTFEATIQNQSVVGTDFFFDIYLQRTGSNDLYLGNAQFILTFNNEAFSSPAITKEAAVAFWNLTCTNGTSVGSLYKSATAVSISGNEIQIQLNQVNFGDQGEFDDNIAKIDNSPNTHQVGRYKVSGISNPSENMNLQWKTVGDPRSKVFTLASSTPWTSTEATGTWTNPANQPLPVELTLFTASVLRDNDVEVGWKTVSETNNYGFEVYRKRDHDLHDSQDYHANQANRGGEWKKLGFVEGHATTLTPQSYSYLDKSVGFGKYLYQIKQIDLDGKSETFPEMAVTVGVGPNKFILAQNYPNPFNPNTVIEFVIPQSGVTSLKVYNLLGQEVATVFEGTAEAEKINTARFDASNFPSGMYFYTLRSAGKAEIKRMIVMK